MTPLSDQYIDYECKGVHKKSVNIVEMSARMSRVAALTRITPIESIVSAEQNKEVEEVMNKKEK